MPETPDQYNDREVMREAPPVLAKNPDDARQPLTFPKAGKKPIAKWGPPAGKGA